MVREFGCDPAAALLLPHQAEDHDPVPPARADIRERSARPVERAEIGGIGRVVGRVRRIEAVILVRIVDVEAQAEPQPFVDRPLLRNRGLAPDDAGRLESVAAEGPRREGVGVAEAVDVEVALLSGEGKRFGPISTCSSFT